MVLKTLFKISENPEAFAPLFVALAPRKCALFCRLRGSYTQTLFKGQLNENGEDSLVMNSENCGSVK